MQRSCPSDFWLTFRQLTYKHNNMYSQKHILASYIVVARYTKNQDALSISGNYLQKIYNYIKMMSVLIGMWAIIWY